MTGRAADADPLFCQAIPLLATNPPSRFYLYVLNIFALTCLRLGRIEEALAIERNIENDVSRYWPTDHHLVYINSLNLARLMRRVGQLDESARYYERAFQTCVGVCSESDLVFKNSCEGLLEDLRGRPEMSCAAWLRTACHWLAMEVPESLAPRSCRILLDGEMPSDFVDVVSELIRSDCPTLRLR